MPTTKGGGGNGPKILIALAVLAVLGVGAYFVLGGGDSDSDRSPADTVKAFFAASQDADCEKMMGLITEASWNDGGDTSRADALKECQEESAGESAFPADTEVANIKTASEEATTATVTATVTGEGQTFDLAFPLVKEDGSWRIQLDDIDLADDVGGEIPGDAGDLPDDSDDFDTDTSLPDLDDLPELPDIPECDYESDEFDPMACAEAMGG